MMNDPAQHRAHRNTLGLYRGPQATHPSKENILAELSVTLHACDPSQPDLQKVSVVADEELPEYAQVWVWDILYAWQLFAMGDVQSARELKETLELWAVNMSSKVFQPHGHIQAKGYLKLSETLKVLDATEPAAEGDRQVRISVAGDGGQLPEISMSPDELAAEHRANLVLGFAQYFNLTNPMFARELPIHVLAMRKYHADIELPHTRKAMEESPFYAIQKAMEYFQAANEGTVQ
jgi:hypothetical protein